MKLKPVDIVVVGAGVAGTLICKELAQTGLRILALERGRKLDESHDIGMPYAHDELRLDRHNELLQNLSRETITFRNRISETALPMREIGSFKPGECVGGAGVHWGCVAYRFLPWDFEVVSRTVTRYGNKRIPDECTSQDWGITFDELEPYYDQFEHVYGVGGKAGNLNGEIRPGGNPFEGARSREFPNPATSPTFTGRVFADAARSLGYTPFSNPSAAMTAPYTNLYRQTLAQCVAGGHCAGFNCAMGAKASPLTAVLPALYSHPNFELRARANVIRVNVDSDKKRATGVTYIDARGREVQQPADLVILTSFVFNNTRLLLLSGIGEPYDAQGNRGIVGKNYAYQAAGKVGMFFEDKIFKPYMGGGARGVAIDDFNGDNFDHASVDFIGGGLIAAVSQGATPIRFHPVPSGTPSWGSMWKKSVARYYDRWMGLHVPGSCQSYRANYLDLDPTYRDAYGTPLLRMTFDWRDNEKKISAYVTSRAAEIAKALCPSKLTVTPLTGRYSIVPYQSTHNTGGAIMGDNPHNSVVNKYLQSWDMHNVFVVGASAFPQNSANNPTATVGALACWTADAIKDQYLKRPGSLV